jgi:hypothetical protein
MTAPSSTSSSEDAAQSGPRPSLGAWLCAIAIAGLLLTGQEAFWRARGVLPSVADDEALWAYHRSRVYSDEGRSVVLLGASRMQVDFSPTAFEARQPGHPLVQLAVSGRAPYATLRDLAQDTNFRGIAIIAVEAAQLAAAFSREAQRSHVDYYHTRWASRDRWGLNADRLELVAATGLQRHLAFMRPDLDVRRLLVQLIETGRLPPTPYNRVLFDRSRPSSYALTNAAAQRDAALSMLRSRALSRPADPARWARRAQEMRMMVSAIRARGGEVVFVRFPTSRERFREEERYFPRNLYWNRLSAETGAQTIHFADVSAMRDLSLPDGSHIDESDAPTFTHALIDELIRRGILSEH